MTPSLCQNDSYFSCRLYKLVRAYTIINPARTCSQNKEQLHNFHNRVTHMLLQFEVKYDCKNTNTYLYSACHVHVSLQTQLSCQSESKTHAFIWTTFARYSAYEAGQFWWPVFSCGGTSPMERIAHWYQVLRNFVGIQKSTKNAHLQSILLLIF